MSKSSSDSWLSHIMSIAPTAFHLLNTLAVKILRMLKIYIYKNSSIAGL